MEKRPFSFHISGRHGRIGFMSLGYAPGPLWKTPPSPSVLRVGMTYLVSDLPNKDLASHEKRPIPFHITGWYDRIGFTSSRYTPGPPWKTPHCLSILWIGRAPALSSPRSRDVFLTFETVSLQFCFKSQALRNGNTPEQFLLIFKHIREKMTLCNFSHFSKPTCVLGDIL